MSGAVIDFLNACAETPGMPPGIHFQQALAEAEEGSAAETEPEASGRESAQDGHDQAVDQISAEPSAPNSDPDLWLYRDRTVAMLRRYMRLSIEVGRLPSLLGREFFRTRVTSYGSSTFEDSVIFVHDVERSLEKLGDFDKKWIARTVLQEYSQEEAARLIGCVRRHAVRCYAEALDRVTEIFLKRGLLSRLPSKELESKKTCQGGPSDEFPVSDSEQAKNKY
ncbi:MAG TPA: hypothetical protein VNZ03_09650 [Terriglobales bacterium]|jgi:hypothetical protein|nr:hypothetical protein [Terriglobales bacterium]